jgi:ribosomal protein S18 acetylase RimI-like enzyme
MIDIKIRAAQKEDAPALQEILARSEHHRHLGNMLNNWLLRRHVINLLGEVDEKILGSIHGEPLNHREAWLHAVCVNQPDQLRSLGKRLLSKLQNEFRKMGIKFIRCTVDSFNRPFQELVTKQGWRVVGSIGRRLGRDIVPQISRLRKSGLRQANHLARSFPILASLAHSNSAERYYFRMTDSYLKLLVQKGAIIATENNSAYAILEHDPGVFPKGVWVTGMGGTRDGICSIIRQISGSPGKKGLPLLIDGPDDPEIQEYMDEMGLQLSAHAGIFDIAECRL